MINMKYLSVSITTAILVALATAGVAFAFEHPTSLSVQAPSCSNSPYLITLNWTAPDAEDEFHIVISPTDDFDVSEQWFTNIPETKRSTSAPDGFVKFGGGPALVLSPNTTYYAKVIRLPTSEDAQTSFRVPYCPPIIHSFTVSSSTITKGQAAKLSWSTSNATSLSLSPGIGSVTGTSQEVSPNQTTTYTLTATNKGGQSTSKSVTVTVIQPPVNKIQEPSPTITPSKTDQPPISPPQSATSVNDSWSGSWLLWIIIGIGAIFVIGLVVYLILRNRSS